jgi:hypothetical protein
MEEDLFDVRAVDLGALNSMTKYPSIPTYHTLDPKNGGLIEGETIAFPGTVLGTEKVDGTNARIISLPDGNFLLGSREELLYAKGDLIGNPALGIVAALREVADGLAPVEGDVVRVHFLEVYGGKVTAASKQYTGTKAVGFRLFDVAVIDDYRAVLAKDAAAVSAWRDAGGQPWLDEDALTATPVCSVWTVRSCRPRWTRRAPSSPCTCPSRGARSTATQAVSRRASCCEVRTGP